MLRFPLHTRHESRRLQVRELNFMQYYENILETVGDTPLVRLGRFFEGEATLLAKLECFNPGSSVKDRIGIAMLDKAEEEGKLKPGGTVVEPTSGNTGLGLALVCAMRGYKLICTAADKITKEKVALLEAYGAKVVTCPAGVDADDPRSYYKTAERISKEEEAYLPYQYYNQENPGAHYRSTGPEIWSQTEGKITHWVAGMGTGGTLTGTGRYLKEQNPDIHVVGIDIEGSIYTHYFKHKELPPDDQIHGYLTDGIGEDFMPGSVWWDAIDEIVTVTDEITYGTTMELARKEAIFTGSSGGGAVYGARLVASRLDADAVVVTLLPDSGERYLSKFNREWLEEKGLSSALSEVP